MRLIFSYATSLIFALTGFVQIDKCLDDGGRWNEADEVCLYEP